MKSVLLSKCRLKHDVERMMERTGRQGRRRRQLLDDLKETSGNRKLKEKALVSLSTELALEEGMDLS